MLIQLGAPAPLQGGTVASEGESGAAVIRCPSRRTNLTVTAAVGVGPQ